MVCRVGQELGTLENHELTKTTARVQVSVDGLKPLIKELIIEFDSRKETSVTLEYEKLKYHCSVCFLLLHSRKNCPKTREEERIWSQTQKTSQTETLYGTDTTSKAQQMERRELEQIKAKKGTDHYSFTARLDRHGKPFGERVSTRQTRAPPPTPITMNGNPPTQTWIHKTTKEGSHEYSSPQYTQNRQTKARETQRGRDLFPQRSQGQWRAKQTVDLEEKSTKPVEQQDQGSRETVAPETLQINRRNTTDKPQWNVHTNNGRGNGGLTSCNQAVLKLPRSCRSRGKETTSPPGRCFGPDGGDGSSNYRSRDSQASTTLTVDGG